MLIYKGNFCFVQVISCFWGELTAISATAPQTAEIPLAKQQPTKVQLHCPDFDNGMKTSHPYMLYQPCKTLHCPDFDNGMKTS